MFLINGHAAAWVVDGGSEDSCIRAVEQSPRESLECCIGDSAGLASVVQRVKVSMTASSVSEMRKSSLCSWPRNMAWNVSIARLALASKSRLSSLSWISSP